MMVGSFRYKCSQYGESGQPVCGCFLTVGNTIGTVSGMNRRIVLPFSLVLLLTATILVFSIFLPRVTFLVDALYNKTVLTVQKRELFFTLLKSGYILDIQEVPLKLDAEQMLDTVKARSQFIIASPLVSMKLKESDIPVNLVGQGRNIDHATAFKHFWLIDEEAMLGAMKYPDLLTALVGEADAKRFSDPFPSDLVFLKGSEEHDNQFAERINHILQERQVITVVAPSLGPWAIPLLQDTSMQWVVAAEYLSMIPTKQQSGVMVTDLVAAVKALLSGKEGTQALKWKLLSL